MNLFSFYNLKGLHPSWDSIMHFLYYCTYFKKKYIQRLALIQETKKKHFLLLTRKFLNGFI